MNTVGPDRRAQYYRMTPAAVIDTLKSHKMGLTNTEAARRLERNGPNFIALPRMQPRDIVLQRALNMASFGTAVAALTTSSTHLLAAAMLLGLAILYLAVAFRIGQTSRLELASVSKSLPTRAQVVRNGSLTTVTNQQLAIGDIVKLHEGDIAPADLRLLAAEHVAADDNLITGAGAYVHKFAHALESAQPLAYRNNLVFAGSRIVSGEGYGIIVATGADMEISRYVEQAAAARTALTPFDQYVTRFVGIVSVTAALISLLVLWLGWLVGAPSGLANSLVAAIVVSAIPSGLLIVALLGYATLAQLLRNAGMRIKGLFAADRLQGLDMLLFDPMAFANETTAVVQQIVIGRTTYTVEGDSYEPAGSLKTTQQKRLTKKELGELSLFFEAGTLAHTSIVVPPDARHASWYLHGHHTEGALLTLARKAYQQTEKLRDAHSLRKHFTYDHHRHMASAVRQYGDDTVVFVYGHPDAVLAASPKLWDHGHVRTISPADRAHLEHHQAVAAAEGLQTMALAYRILPKRTSLATLTADKAEQKLTFLGFADIAHSTHTQTQAILSAARRADVKVSLLSVEPLRYGIDSERLCAIDDAQLLARLRKGTATFTGLSAEEKVRLVRVAQEAHHRVAITGASLSDVPAMLQADASLMSLHAIGAVRSAATVQTTKPELFFKAIDNCTALSRLLYAALLATTASTAATASLAALNGFAALLFHIPPAIGAVQLLVLQLLLQPLLLVAMPGAKPEASLLARYYAQKTAVTMGLAAGWLAYGSYLMFFALKNINPLYLDIGNQLVRHAASITLVTLVLCAATLVLLATSRRHRLLPGLLLCAMVAIMLFALYTPCAQRAIGLCPITFTDWLLPITAALVFAAFNLFERHTRHHARHAIVALFRDHSSQAV